MTILDYPTSVGLRESQGSRGEEGRSEPKQCQAADLEGRERGHRWKEEASRSQRCKDMDSLQSLQEMPGPKLFGFPHYEITYVYCFQLLAFW